MRSWLTVLLAVLLGISPARAQSWVVERVRDAEASIVRIKVDRRPPEAGAASRPRDGTGFFVSRQGHLVTSAHLIADAHETTFNADKFNGTIDVFLQRGSTVSFSAQILNVNVQKDVAVLKLIDTAPVKPLRFARSVNANEGELFVYAGYPNRTWTHNIARLTNASAADGRWTLEMSTSPGASGAPLLDACGRVVALIRGAYAVAEHHQSQVVPQAEFFDLVREYAGPPDERPCGASDVQPQSKSAPQTSLGPDVRTVATAPPALKVTTEFCAYKSGPKLGRVERFADTPMAIGAGCHDGRGSSGAAIVTPASADIERLSLDPRRWSKTCRYTVGLKAGQSESFARSSFAPVDARCEDGKGSEGEFVRER